eukprot:TRINITY_DN36766_c0_g1_i2.p1 TRINITY_DN36766_c0_g1~~TRINITY_DN36766_c0_g1_i2.p1  ORF type:complete len:218 (+),score=49.03 TRINITY_DN36766_c0_g1_i2:72-725(+)
MMMVASSVVLTVVVLNYHHRTAETHVMPMWVRSVFLQWLPWILRMNRPRKKITRKTILMNNRMKELEMKEKVSKSLLANVLDMDDDFRPLTVGGGTFMRVNGNPLENNVSQANHINHNSHGQLGTAPSTPNLHHASSTSQLLQNSACSSNTRELQCILKEIRYMTNRLKLKDEEEEVVSDWKFAAMVIDRFCLITFTTFTIITTVAVLLSAPHIVVE